MKLIKAKNCEGCRALDLSSYKSCELGFNNRGEFIKTIGMNRIKPQEPCLKPRTIEKLFEARELVREGKAVQS